MNKEFFKSVQIFGAIRLLLISSSVVVFISCGNDSTSVTDTDDSTSRTSNDSNAAKPAALKPKGSAPAWAPNIKDEMAVVMEKLASYNAPPIESLSAQEARKQPTPTTAVMDVMTEHSIPMPPPGVDTMVLLKRWQKELEL